MRRSRRSILLSMLAILVLVGGLAAPTPRTSASATAPVERQSMPGPLVYFYAAHTDQPAPKVPPPADFLQQRANGMRTQTATITVNYNPGFTPEAQAAFQFAVDIWAAYITSPVPITVDAYWASLGPGVLGGARPLNAAANFPGVPIVDTWYSIATANKLYGSDLDPGVADIEADFNSSFTGWYFGTDGNTPFDKWDFVSVVLHELGHGLGFYSTMRGAPLGNPTTARWGDSVYGYPYIYDRYAVNGVGQLLISGFPNNSAELLAQLTSGNIYFNGASAVKANGGSNIKLYAPSPWDQGSSFSHLDQVFNETPNALMTFSLDNGEAQHNPGSVTLCMFKDMGWTVSVSGASAASVPGFTAFSPDNVTAADGSTIYLPLITNSYSTGPC